MLSRDASAFSAEARRRVKVNRDKKFSGVEEGNRILVLGEDEDGKTDDLGPILVKLDQSFSRINWSQNQFFNARLLGPLELSDDEENEEELGKNHSSVILNMTLAGDAAQSAVARFLSGGDAEVLIWERLWGKYRFNTSALQYNMLQTPHHCSWHSLSYDSWSDLGGDAEVCKDARSALSQILPGGIIVASSCPIHDDDSDPPCIGAKREYVAKKDLNWLVRKAPSHGRPRRRLGSHFPTSRSCRTSRGDLPDGLGPEKSETPAL